MELKNVSANFLGDSITEGCGTSGADKTFHAVLAKKAGMKIARNYGIGGTRIADQKDRSQDPDRNRSYCERFPSMDDDASLIVVFGGTNDFGHGDAPFGDFSDNTEYTFCGACKRLFQKLIDKFGKEKIIVILPLHRFGEDNLFGDGSKKIPSKPLEAYVRAIREIARGFELAIIDLWEEERLNPNRKGSESNFADGLHPNPLGHRILAEKIKEKLESFGREYEDR